MGVSANVTSNGGRLLNTLGLPSVISFDFSVLTLIPFDPYVNNGALVEQDGREAERVDIANFWLIYRFIWINSCMLGTNRPLR